MTEPSTPMATRATLRRYIGMIVGSALSTFAGIFIGINVALIPAGTNPATISFVCLTGIYGWLFWVRRKHSVLSTIGLCTALFFVWYPLALILREATRPLYR